MLGTSPSMTGRKAKIDDKHRAGPPLRSNPALVTSADQLFGSDLES